MDLDDFDELDDKPTQVPRVKKFLPKSSLNKTVPKPESPPPKPAPQPPDVSILKKRKSEENLTSSTLTVHLSPKIESSALNGAVKMETKPLPDVRMEPKTEEPVDSDSNELEEEEDMIVREIDVFFNASIDADTQLLVMQYPLRACWRPYELDERCEEVRVKPSTAEIEMDLSMNVDSNNWDSDRAIRVNITKQTLSSSWKPSVAGGYAVGVLVGDKLHVNPINAVVQLRPSTDQFKSGGLKRKKNVPSNAEVAVKLEASNENKSVGPSKKQNKQMEGSVEQKRTNEEEGWVPLKYHGSKSDFSARFLQRMLAQENSPLHFTVNPCEYVSSLCPGACDSKIKSKCRSSRILFSMPLEERVRKLLCEVCCKFRQ
ncbi:DNA-directed RNA polymerase III subunit RPC5-like [Pistacia vera]|uniref:DNA-directed RNA polymerase III subunit RPC5-like n=1 Tax=Pistacia vera TaxID=55513 RepID=UPI001262CA47|nr:DNA-directed RNA polymerase III subunit RPC5-like [Pistacia vera]